MHNIINYYCSEFSSALWHLRHRSSGVTLRQHVHNSAAARRLTVSLTQVTLPAFIHGYVALFNIGMISMFHLKIFSMELCIDCIMQWSSVSVQLPIIQLFKHLWLWIRDRGEVCPCCQTDSRSGDSEMSKGGWMNLKTEWLVFKQTQGIWTSTCISCFLQWELKWEGPKASMQTQGRPGLFYRTPLAVYLGRQQGECPWSKAFLVVFVQVLELQAFMKWTTCCLLFVMERMCCFLLIPTCVYQGIRN